MNKLKHLGLVFEPIINILQSGALYSFDGSTLTRYTPGETLLRQKKFEKIGAITLFGAITFHPAR